MANVLLFHTTALHWKDFSLPLVDLSRRLEKQGLSCYHLIADVGPCVFSRSRSKDLQVCWELLASILPEDRLRRASDFVDASMRTSAQKQCQKAHGFEQATKIWPDLKGSVCHYFRKPVSLKQFLVYHSVFQDFVQAYYLNNALFAKVFDRCSFDSVLYYNGLHYRELLLKKQAQKKNVKVLAFETTCFKDRWHFDLGGTVGNGHSFQASDQYTEFSPLSTKHKAKLEYYLQKVYQGQLSTVKQSLPRLPKPVFQNHQRKILFLAQLPYDTVMSYDNPHFGSQDALLKQLLAIVKEQPSWQLCIRAHPLDQSFGQEKLGSLPANAFVVQGREYNTYELMDQADIGLTVCSQSGLEMLAKGKSVLVLGRAFYTSGVWSCTFREGDDLKQKIEQTLHRSSLNPKQQQAFNAYLYQFIFRQLYEVDPQNRCLSAQSLKRLMAVLHPARSVQRDVFKNVSHKALKFKLSQSAQSLYDKAYCLMATTHDYDRAILLWKKLLEKSKFKMEASYYLARCYRMQGKKNKEYECLAVFEHKPVKNRKLWAAAYFYLARLCVQSDAQKAKKYLEQCLQWFPEHAQAKQCLAEVL